MQVASNLPNHVPAQGQPQRLRRNWHSESDVTERRQLIQHMYVAEGRFDKAEAVIHKRCYYCRFQLLTQRKPNVTQEWKEKLPDFVKRLEEALYQNAASKVNVSCKLLTVLKKLYRNCSRRRST